MRWLHAVMKPSYTETALSLTFMKCGQQTWLSDWHVIKTFFVYLYSSVWLSMLTDFWILTTYTSQEIFKFNQTFRHTIQQSSSVGKRKCYKNLLKYRSMTGIRWWLGNGGDLSGSLYIAANWSKHLTTIVFSHKKNVIKTYIAGTCIMSVTCRITGNILLLSNWTVTSIRLWLWIIILPQWL